MSDRDDWEERDLDEIQLYTKEGCLLFIIYIVVLVGCIAWGVFG